MPPWAKYTVLRLLLFAVPLVVLLLFQVAWPVAVIAAALIGLCLSYLLLRTQRDAVARKVYESRHKETPIVTVDSEVEDAAIDAASGPTDEPRNA
ncbi:MAG: hypothetical protein QOF36_1569 [Microbacteriaceae bacterium]|nr:hypothetical protein [Microbacteriaceae bacterium]